MENPQLEVYETLPIVPLRDVVVFPHMMMPFVIGRPSSTRALEHALLKDKRIFLAAQHDASVDDPRPEDIYTMGCVANVVQSLKLPDGNIQRSDAAIAGRAHNGQPQVALGHGQRCFGCFQLFGHRLGAADGLARALCLQARLLNAYIRGSFRGAGLIHLLRRPETAGQ